MKKIILIGLALFLTGCIYTIPKRKDIVQQINNFFPKELMYAVETDKGIKVVVRNKVLFAKDDFRLKAKAKNILKRLAFIYSCKILPYYPKSFLVIEGHTDSDGPADYNQRLSEKRAKEVFLYLNSLPYFGVEKSRMKYIGYGEERPAVPNTSKKNKALNRRVEIYIDGI